MDKGVVVVVFLALTFGFTVTGYAQEADLLISLNQYRAPVFLQLSDQTYLLKVADIEDRMQRSDRPPLNAGRVTGYPDYATIWERPPLNAGRVTGEILAGGLVGFAGGAGGALLFLAGGGYMVELGAYGIGAPAGYLLGNAIGVYFIGKIGNETGSFVATLGGGLLAMGIGAVVEAFLWSTTNNDNLGLLLHFVGLPVWATTGSIIGFNLTRRYDSLLAKTALINFRDGRMSLAVPGVHFQPDSFGRGNLSQSVDLLRARF